MNTPQNGFVPPAVTVSERLVTSAKEAEMSKLRKKSTVIIDKVPEKQDAQNFCGCVLSVC